MIPALLTVCNLLLYRRPPNPRTAEASSQSSEALVSILIPARNEEANIARCLEAVRSSRHVSLEILVLDDHSDDDTAARVREVAARDGRVRLLHSKPLPAGWNGKQHACWQLAEAAKGEWLLFLDADVELSPDAPLRLTAAARERRLDLLSGFPRQLTGTLLERLLIPLIHFLLLGFLPLVGMRWTKMVGFAAACGQLVLARRSAYFEAGGHRTICATRHDGLQLPRAFRRARRRTDLVDVTELATCRMYRGGAEVWNGLAKNATEGMASRIGILVWTPLLLGGQVLPFLMLVLLLATPGLQPEAVSAQLPVVLAACVLALGTRAVLAVRFQQSYWGVLLHPISIVLLLAIQLEARLREELGRPVAWKGRVRV